MTFWSINVHTIFISLLYVNAHVFLKVGSGEFEGVEKGVGGSQSDVVARLVFLHPVHDGRQNLVGLLLKAPVVDVLADVTDGFQRRLFSHLCTVHVGHILQQDLLQKEIFA